jgi:hypothetical protein
VQLLHFTIAIAPNQGFDEFRNSLMRRKIVTDNFGFIALRDLPISRGTAYRLARASKLKVVRLGRHAGVLASDWEKFLASLPAVGRQRSARHAAATAARWRKARESAE